MLQSWFFSLHGGEAGSGAPGPDLRMGRARLSLLGFGRTPRNKTPDFSTLALALTTLLHCGRAQDAVLTVEPDSSTFYTSETVTFACDARSGKDTDWYYSIRKDNWDWIPYSLDKNRTLQVLRGYSGEYQCVCSHKTSQELRESNKVSLTVTENRPKAVLSKDVTAGGAVTLTCSVNSSSSRWRYEWYGGRDTSDPLTPADAHFLSHDRIEVSRDGPYSCRGGRGNPVYYTDYSDLTARAVVALQHKWPEVYLRHEISLVCRVEPGGDVDWDYVWTTPREDKSSKTNEYRISYVTESNSGEYRCQGRNRELSTAWSDAFTLTPVDVPQPVLNVSLSWLSAGGSVTLSCSMPGPPAGWRFYWYKAVPSPTQNHYSYQPLPGSANGTHGGSFGVRGQTHTAGYACRARWGNPAQFTLHSQAKFVWVADAQSAVSLTVRPDRAQHFPSESVSLSCEGNSTEWKVRKFDVRRSWLAYSDCSSWGTMTGSTCRLSTPLPSDTVYWCESSSGQFSNAVNITASYDIVLASPAHPVVEGVSVTLSCRAKTKDTFSKVLFYQNDKLVQNGSEQKLTIPAVALSHQGFYKCEGQNVWSRTSPQSWMSVKPAAGPEDSPFPVLLLVGLICGFLLLVLLLLLLLLLRCRKPRDSGVARPQSTNHSSARDHMSNQDATLYTSVLNGDAGLYETIREQEDPDDDKPQEVTYSAIHLKSIAKKGRNDEPEESCVYADVRTAPRH